jgi:hypothetical protein
MAAVCVLLTAVGAYRSPSLPVLQRDRGLSAIRACEDLYAQPLPALPAMLAPPAAPRTGQPIASAGALAASLEEENARLASRVAELENLLGRTEGLCELLDDEGACSQDGTCLSNDGFAQALRARGVWLLGLLALQSCSSFVLVRQSLSLAGMPVAPPIALTHRNLPAHSILTRLVPEASQAENEALLTSHPSIVCFLTMLVGAGGNAGNQAAVRGIRGLVR